MKKLKKYRGPAVLDVGQAVVQFSGTPQAEIFGLLVNESLAGTLRENPVGSPRRLNKPNGKQGLL